MLDDVADDFVLRPDGSLAKTRSEPEPAHEDRLHRSLTQFNHRRFTPGLPMKAWRHNLDHATQMHQVEIAFLEHERRAVTSEAASAPRDAGGFIHWFENLRETAPGQGDALFPWLAEEAPISAMRWFLTQEVAGEAGFDDLVALTQLRMPLQPKLELARNYWDEMGRGNPKGVHGGMLETLGNALALEPKIETTVWEALALANTMAGLAANRCYAYHSIGALGAIELTAPGRSTYVAQGLRRLGIRADDRHYFDLHAILDVKHSLAWNEEVIRPLVASNPLLAPAIAEGALMRLRCGARCFDRYRRELGFSSQSPV